MPVDEDDADTTAARVAPAVSTRGAAKTRDSRVEAPDGADADDATVQKPPEILRDSSPDEHKPVTGARPRGPARPPMPTLLGTGPGGEEEEHESVTERAKLGIVILPALPPARPAVTSQAVAPEPTSDDVPDGEDGFEETEVRTTMGTVDAATALAAPLTMASPGVSAADAKRRVVAPTTPSAPTAALPKLSDDDDESDDSVTAQAPMIRMPSSPSFAREPPIAISPKSLVDPPSARPTSPALMDPPTSPRGPSPSLLEAPTERHDLAVTPAQGRAQVSPSARVSIARDDDPYEEDDSITTRGPAVSEESVTSRSAAHPSSRLPVVTAPPPSARVRAGSRPSAPPPPAPLPHPKAAPAPPRSSADSLADGTEGTTKKVRRPSESPADEEPESVTTQAPGHLTNILRVIAADTSSSRVAADDADAGDDDELLENKTAVMANAPFRGIPGSGPVAAVSPLHAQPMPPPHHGMMGHGHDHASESALRLAPGGAPPIDHANMSVLGVAPHAHGRDAPLGVLPYPPSSASGPAPTKPRYGALVAVVAIVSICAPIAVFYALRGAGDEVAPSPRAPLTPSSEIVRRTEPARIKASKTAPSHAPAVHPVKRR